MTTLSFGKHRGTDTSCKCFDTWTLAYYIETNRDGLAESARVEWRRRWNTDYPIKRDCTGREYDVVSGPF